MSVRLRVNPIACEAHGMCAELLPEWIELDDWGYPIVAGEPVPPELARARAARGRCLPHAGPVARALAVRARRRHVIARWWPALALAAIGGVIAVLLIAHSDGGSATAPAPPGSTTPTRTKLVARTMSRPLDAPVSGEAAVAVGDRVWVIGGLDAGDARPAASSP